MIQGLAFVRFDHFLGLNFHPSAAVMLNHPGGFTLFLHADSHLLPPPLLAMWFSPRFGVFLESCPLYVPNSLPPEK